MIGDSSLICVENENIRGLSLMYLQFNFSLFMRYHYFAVDLY
jgi:hypothetical protein